MRKLTIELKIKEEFFEMLNFILDKVESIELIDLIKLDFEQGTKMGIAALNMKKGFTIDDIEIPDFMEMLSVLKQDGDKYIVVSKVKIFEKFMSFAKKFDIDIKWDTPSIFKKGEMVISVTGDDENLKKFLNVVKYLGEIKKMSFIKPIFNEQMILSCLTNKQKEILIAAKKNGYYSYPRKIDSKKLSEIVGLSKPTVVQHLRKAEIRLVSNILTGY
jgi:predicted DNA binding protein